MVNGSLPRIEIAATVLRPDARKAAQRNVRFPLGTSRNGAASVFAQILGKLYVFKLPENLRRMLLDYEENRSCTANAAFSGAC
jgi:hypothetical protein